MAVFLSSAPVSAQEATFQLSGVRFDDSVYLNEAELQAAIAPYMNRPITFADVERMIAAVEAVYAARGVVTASVVLQPQEVADGGVLRLTLIEARTEDLIYDARTDYQQRLIGYNFPRDSVGTFPDYDEITRQLRFFQIAYGVLPTVTFAPGQGAATTVQTVAIDVEPSANWRVQLDNHANDAQDRTRLSVTRDYFDLTGRLDSLTATATITQGGPSVSASYRIPVGPYGGSATVSGSASVSEVVAGAFAASQLETRGLEISGSYSQPFRVTDQDLWQFQVGLNASNTQSTIVDVGLQDTTLVDVEGRVTFARSLARAAISADAGLRVGTASSADETATDGGYAIGFANAAYDRQISDRFALQLTGRVQIAPDQNLPSGQRFSLGGLGNLEGYPDDVRTGDSGLAGRARVTCNAPCFDGGFATYRPEIYGFADLGWIDTFRGDDALFEDKPWLASVGMGAQAQVGALSVSASIGVPLAETTGFDDVGAARFYAAAAYAF